MPVEDSFQIIQREPAVPGVFEYDVIYTPVMPLKYIKVDFVLNKPIEEKIKLKTRYQILKDVS